MKTFLRFLGCLLAICLLATTSLAAYEQDPNLNPPGEFPICKERIPLTIGVAQKPTVEDWDTNYMTGVMEELCNADLTFLVFPAADMRQKIDLMIASGGDELPDIIFMTPGDATLFAYGQSGAIIPLTAYYENSAYYIPQTFEAVGYDYTDMVRSPDGEIYAISTLTQSFTSEYPARIYMNQVWLDTLGLEAPRTVDELYEVLKAFKEQDPNGNGLADEIPSVGCINDSTVGGWILDALMNPFVYSDGTGWLIEDGVVSVNYITDGYRQGLQYLHKLVSEDLVSPLTFTQDKASYVSLMLEETPVVGMVVGMTTGLGGTDERKLDYAGIGPLEGYDGNPTYTAYLKSLPVAHMMISANCENPEAAFRLGDLMVSEEISILDHFGEKGVDWLEPEEGDISPYVNLGYPPVLKPVLVWGSVQNKYWAEIGPHVRTYATVLGLVPTNPLDNAWGIGAMIEDYIGKAPAETMGKLIYTEEESARVQEKLSLLATYREESRARFAVGDLDIHDDNAWQSYLAEIEKIGLGEVLEVVQTVYDRMYQ